MKTLILILTTTLAAAASAAPSQTSYSQTVQKVRALEASGRTFEALMVSVQASQEISRAIGVEQVASTVNSKLNEMREEIITEKETMGGSFSFLGLISGSARTSRDYAKIITTNPEEVASFGGKVARDFQKLQSNLAQYVQKNEQGLVYAKAFAAKALQLASTMSYQERRAVVDQVARTVQQVQKMNFYGSQNIESCVTTQYMNRTNSVSAALGGLLLSASFERKHEYFAHTTKSCSQSSNSAQVSEAVLVSSDLAVIDAMIESYDRELGLKELTEAKAQSYPTWGLPSYQ